MTSRRWIALTATLAAGLALVAGSSASWAATLPAPGADVGAEDVPTIESVELFEQPMDTQGRPIGPRVRVDPRGHQPDGAAGRAPRRTRTGEPAAGRRALQSASGCKTVWVARTRTSVFGSLLWRYQQDKYFCWSYPRVTVVNVSAYPCCLDPFWRWAGQVGSAGYFFTRFGNSYGGHYSFRQGKFQQTVLGQVTATATPWTKLWAHGDGTWAYATDVSA
jgi:hypothetical protein